jgi:hypothetical protein
LNEAFNRMCENKYVMGFLYETCAAFSKRPMLPNMQPEEREQIIPFDLPKYFLVENEIVTRGEGSSD